MPEEHEIFLTAEDVAERWKVDRITIYRMCNSDNALPHFRISNGTARSRYRFRMSDILAYEKQMIGQR